MHFVHLMQNMLKLMHIASVHSKLFFISGNLLSWYHDNRISHICPFAPTFFHIHNFTFMPFLWICSSLFAQNWVCPIFSVPLMHITLGQHTIQYIVDPNLSIIEYLYHHQITNISISTTNAIPKNEINLSIINLQICIYQWNGC